MVAGSWCCAGVSVVDINFDLPSLFITPLSASQTAAARVVSLEIAGNFLRKISGNLFQSCGKFPPEAINQLASFF